MPDPKPLPSQEYLHRLFILDEVTGVLIWRYRPDALECWNKRCAGRPAGHLQKRGYVVVYIDNIPFKAHRVIWKMINGADPSPVVDHRDRHKNNNAGRNLRPATNSGSAANRSRPRAELPRYVYRSRNKYIAQVRKDGVLHHLGTFDTVAAAEAVSIKAARRLHGEFCYA